MKNTLFLLALLFLGCQPNNNKSTALPAAPTESAAPQPSEEVTSTLTEEAPSTPPKQALQNGDLIFHTSTSSQSLAIQIASQSKYSHVGIIYQEGDDFYVYEAVQPIKLTPAQDFINRGKDKHYVVKRLKNSDQVLTPEAITKMKNIGKKYLGKNYDFRFEWSDDKIYCSELVWKIYKQAFDIEIGKLQQIKDFDLSDPVVKAKAKERYGDNIPMEELIITPDRMYQSDQLVMVFEK